MQAKSVGQTPSASELVIDAVAAREGVDPLELTVPLYDAIDADELDALVGPGTERAAKSGVEVTFAYYGYEVTVTADGTVSLTDDS